MPEDPSGAEAVTRLEAQFQSACDEAVDVCKALKPPYVPTAWIGMSHRYGAAEAARRLIISGDIQTGFERLIKAGRPELTIEWAVLDPQWGQLFNSDHRDAARWRLSQGGINPPR